MSFEKALTLLKTGHVLQRQGWNGKGLYVRMVVDSTITVGEQQVNVQPYFVIVNSSKTVNTWVPSVSDIVANDWQCLGLVGGIE